MCRFCHVLLLLGTRREISVHILHIGFLSVHTEEKKNINFLTCATYNNTRKQSLKHFDLIGTLSGQAATQKSILGQFIPILSRPIISNGLSPGSCQRDVFVLMYMNVHTCILYYFALQFGVSQGQSQTRISGLKRSPG